MKSIYVFAAYEILDGGSNLHKVAVGHTDLVSKYDPTQTNNTAEYVRLLVDKMLKGVQERYEFATGRKNVTARFTSVTIKQFDEDN